MAQRGLRTALNGWIDAVATRAHALAMMGKAAAAMRPNASALFHAVCHGDERSVRQMLTDGADIHAQARAVRSL